MVIIGEKDVSVHVSELTSKLIKSNAPWPPATIQRSHLPKYAVAYPAALRSRTNILVADGSSCVAS